MKLKPLLVAFLQFYVATSSPTSPSVVVVGAGPAGIAAATRLVENGFKHVVILEAENRIGGRIHSVFFGEAYIDLGAEWCHGEKDNIVYEKVKDFNILRHTEFNHSIYHSSKKGIDDEFRDEIFTIMKSIYIPDVDKDQDEMKGKTIGRYCVDKYNSTIHERYQTSPEKLELAKSSMDLFHHLVLSFEGAFSWFEPSAINDYKYCKGDPNLNWNGLGFKTALEVLMKKFPDPSNQLPLTILLDKEVVKVFWNKTAAVVCSDGTTFEVDHVIVTPSIGVLKEKQKTMFYPQLPEKKQTAIRQIGIGAVMKIVLHFKNRWWAEPNFVGLNFMWSEEDRNIVLKEFPEGPLKEGRSWLTEVYEISPVEYNPNVLIAWITGDMIPQIEVMGNETMIEGVEFLLNKFIGHKYNVTKPDKIIRTTWYSNPHFRGSYSYQTLEARKNNVTAEVELAKPLLNAEGLPVVLFAGEATHPYFYSTVHGAIETGYREADRLINLYK